MVPNSTAFLPLFKPGTFSSPTLRLELLGNRKGYGSIILQSWCGRKNPKPTSRVSISLCYARDYVTLRGERDFSDIIKVTNQLTLN